MSAPCSYCKGEGKVLRYGSGEFAALHACPVCRDGRKLADTLIPSVRTTAEGQS